MNNSISKGLLWKLLERFGVFGSQFVLQIVLARLLDPAYYGMLAVMTIFTTLANVFIQTGFNTALIQNKDVTEEDYSSVFWATLLIAGVLYLGLFAAAPVIAAFYEMPQIIAPFRVLILMLFPGALNSVQLAKVSREMDFKKVFLSNVAGVLVSGTVGIVCALLNFGLWALTIQVLLNICISCVVMFFTVRWRPRLICNAKRLKVLFGFGWKLLLSNLIDTLYRDLSSLIVGKKYNAETLGFYNKGQQFPQTVITPITGAIQSVLLPAMSKEQDQTEQVKSLTRLSVTTGSYVIFPMMAGLAAAAEPIVRLLLTDKWLPCVPYLQLFCVSYAFWPLYISNLQAINAVGRSDIYLKLEFIKKIIEIVPLCIAVFCFESPLAIAVSIVATAPLSILINAFPNKKLIGYPFAQQMADILPALLLSCIMFALVYAVQWLALPTLVTLLLQMAVGAGSYVLLSVVFKIKIFYTLLNMIRRKGQPADPN